MPEKTHFLHKLLNRLDKVDKKALETYLRALAGDLDRLGELLEYVPAGVLCFNEDRRISYANPQAAGWLGLNRPVTPPRLVSLEEVLDEELRALLEQRVSAAAARPVDEIRILAPKEMFLRLLFIPRGDDAAGETAVILVNVTAEKAHEAERLRMVRHESVLRLGASVAHEIGNPLNAIDIHLNLLKKETENLPAARKKSLLKTVEVLQSETRRLDRIVRSFLKAVRKPPLQLREEDLNLLIQEALDFFRPEMQERKIRASFRPDPELPAFSLDRNRIREAVDNLIKNAMDAMPEGGPLAISVSHKGRLVLLRLKDRGQGIREEDLPHIFDAYYTTKIEGSGLGLMIVHDAVVEHGGRIEVQTKAGRGTTFSILLPIRKPNLQISHNEPLARGTGAR